VSEFDLPFFPDTGFWQEPDFLLSDLVSMLVNHAGIQFGITLMVKGMVVSGLLISEREYLAELSKYFQDQAKDAIKSAAAAASKADMRKMLQEAEEAWDFTYLTEDVYPESDRQAGEKAKSGKNKEKGGEEDVPGELTPADFPTIRHIHLKDVEIVFHSPGLEFMQTRVSTWRVRLTAVDGWLVGRSVAQIPFPSSDELDD